MCRNPLRQPDDSDEQPLKTSPMPRREPYNGLVVPHTTLRQSHDSTRELLRLSKLMGRHLIGPGVWQSLGITCVGDLSPLPKALSDELLATDCILTGRRVSASNRLFYVPAGLSIFELADKANVWCEKHRCGPAFRPSLLHWLGRQDFAKESKSSGEWVLMPLAILPDSKNKNDSQQEALMRSDYPEYYTPDARAAFCAVIGEYIQNGNRALQNDCGRCQNCVFLGGFTAHGLIAYQHADANNNIGRAACRNLQ